MITKEQAAKKLAKELGVYDRWNEIERYFYLLSGKNERSIRMNGRLFKDLKRCVALIGNSDKKLADRLDDFIGEALIDMPLSKKATSVFGKWYYELR